MKVEHSKFGEAGLEERVEENEELSSFHDDRPGEISV